MKLKKGDPQVAKITGRYINFAEPLIQKLSALLVTSAKL